ncbi:HLH transcription factor [Pseudohyphozyma bogoriensis]|nr:HLH transcription factor [Pseudohyphozyma bogoriensis]
MATTSQAPPPYGGLYDPSPYSQLNGDAMQDIFEQLQSQHDSDEFNSPRSLSGTSDAGMEQRDYSEILNYIAANGLAPGVFVGGAEADRRQRGGGSGDLVDYSTTAATTMAKNGEGMMGYTGYNGGSIGMNGGGLGGGAAPAGLQSAPSSSSSTASSSPAFTGATTSSTFTSYPNSSTTSSSLHAIPFSHASPSLEGTNTASPPGGSYYPSTTTAAYHGSSAFHPTLQTPSIDFSTYSAPRASLSPRSTDSLSPYTPPHNPSSGSAPGGSGNFIHNEALARILADAQVQGQLHAQAQSAAMAQAAFNASYIANLQHQQQQQAHHHRPQPLLVAPHPHQQSQPPSTQPVQYYHQPPIQPSSIYVPGNDDNESKKRKVVAMDDTQAEPSVNIARSHLRQSQSGPSGSRGGRKSVGEEEAAPFSFTIKSSAGQPTTSVPRSSVEVIANAGIPSAPDARKVYQDDTPSKVTIARRGSQKHQADSVASTSTPTTKSVKATATKPVEASGVKKAEAVKKVDQKKKGSEKGHNAVERRYRNNINNAIATLRDIIPALRHLKPLPSMPASRRRASQFTLSTSAQAPTPHGLIDGIPAAKTLSKGTILQKSIEYIQFLQGARIDAGEDLEIFKTVVREMVGGGERLVEEFERRRGEREVEREGEREKRRREQAVLDGEESEEEEGEGDEVDARMESTSEQGEELGSGQEGSPNSSNGGEVHAAHAYPPQAFASAQRNGNANPPSRMLLASFMGVSFAGGLGYDWTYGAASAAESASSARAWSGGLVRRAFDPTVAGPSMGPKAALLVSSEVVHPAILTGLVFLGFASIVAVLGFLLSPFVTRSTSSHEKSVSECETKEEKEPIIPRSVFRQQRRALALESLAQLNDSASSSPTYADERQSALKARRELLRLVGAPTYGLVPALAKETLATALRNVTTIRVGSFANWSEEDRREAAVAWVRIAEIEAALGGVEINFLARCYTFMRLFNLSRSSHWPQTTSSTSRSSVNAILAIIAEGLGQPLSASALWNQASKSRKKSDAVLDPWTEIAISTSFEEVRTILKGKKAPEGVPEPSDTVPLLRISEARCEAALRETWARLFVAVVQSHSTLSPDARFSTIADQPRLEETISHVISSTSDGSSIHSMAKITRAFCAFWTHGAEYAAHLANELVREANRGGPVSRLTCAPALFAFLLPEEMDFVMPESTSGRVEMEVDTLASATLGWLNVRRQSEALLEAPKPVPTSPGVGGERRGEGGKVFTDPALIAFCASPVADALKFLRTAGLGEEASGGI